MKKICALMLSLALTLAIAVPAFAVEEGLDDATKQAYYAEYVEIAKDVGKETELDISVLPMSEFTEDDWRTPEEFRTVITEIANWRIDCTETNGIQPYSTASTTKFATVTADGRNYRISITGSFNTNYNPTTGRQHFSGINSISSQISGNTGIWKQTGYERNLMDAARTYGITVSGELTIAGAKFANKLAYVEFYCSSTGEVR